METTERYRVLQQGEMLNWYRIERVLGRGGFGVIYLATDTNLDHQVAIKEYVPGALASQTTGSPSTSTATHSDDLHRWGLERFLREARNLVKFKHPNIVRVSSVFQQNDSAYMVMEFERGEELRSYMSRSGVASESQLRALIVPIAEGLAEVHRRGFIHRDVKPSNILVRDDGSPVLLDFGSARETRQLAESAFTALVSTGYAPLEQYSTDSDQQQGPWTDIYALGGVLYFAIGGSDPVDSTRRGSALLNGGRDPLISARLLGEGRYSEPFLAAIDWALGFRIAERPQTLADWVPALLMDTSPAEPGRQTRPAEAGVSLPGNGLRRRATDSRRADDPEPGELHSDHAIDTGSGRSDSMPRTGARARGRTGAPYSRRASPSHLAPARHENGGNTAARRGQTRSPGGARLATARVDVEERPLSSWQAFDHWLLQVARYCRYRLRRVLRFPVVVLMLITGIALVIWYADERKDDARRQARAEAREEARQESAEAAVRPVDAKPADETVAAATTDDAAGNIAAADEKQASKPATVDTADDEASADEASVAEQADAPVDTRTDDAEDAPLTTTERRAAARAAAAQRAEAKDRVLAEQRRAERREAERVEAERLKAERRRAERLEGDRLEAERLQAERRDDRQFSEALSLFERALKQGDLNDAQAELAAARALNNDDERLPQLQKSLDAALAEGERPLSDEDMDVVLTSFNALARAIESGNEPAMDKLTKVSNQNALFAQLLKSFESIDIDIVGVRVRNASKTISATLRIRDMERSNGAIATPSESYRDRVIVSRRKNGEWSLIEW